MSLLLLFNNPRSPRHLQLLRLAKELHGEGRADVAIVTAQTACEVYAEVAIREMLRARKLGEFEAVIPELLNSYSLTDRRGQQVFHALTGKSIQRSDLWPGYKAHVELRNRIVHRGVEPTVDEASDSIAIAEAFHELVATAWEEAPSSEDAGAA